MINSTDFALVAATTGWAMGLKVMTNSRDENLGWVAGAYGSGDSISNYYFYGGEYTSPAMVIKPYSGYVGINTTSPTYLLDVNGNMRATGRITAAGLTSSASIVANAGLSTTTLSASGQGSFDTLKITSTSGTSHLIFSRANYNYITAPSGGYISFNTNGVGTGFAVSDLTIHAHQLFPGTTNAVTFGISTKRWSNVYSVLGNFSGLVTASAGVQIGSTSDIGWYNYNSRIVAGINVARGVNVGSLLVSNAWSDYTKVPTNGIYCKGNVHIAGGYLTIGQSTLSEDYTLNVNGDTWIEGLLETRGGIDTQGDLVVRNRLFIPSSEGNDKYYIRIE